MTTIKMKYEGNVNEGLMKFIEGLKISNFDKSYNSMCLNVVSFRDKQVFQVDRVYDTNLTNVDFESELYEVINDSELDECSLVGSFIFELMKYRSEDAEDEVISPKSNAHKLVCFIESVLDANSDVDSIIEFLNKK